MLVSDSVSAVFRPRALVILDILVVRRVAEGQGKGTEVPPDRLLEHSAASCPELAAQGGTTTLGTWQCSTGYFLSSTSSLSSRAPLQGTQ